MLLYILPKFHHKVKLILLWMGGNKNLVWGLSLSYGDGYGFHSLTFFFFLFYQDIADELVPASFCVKETLRADPVL